MSVISAILQQFGIKASLAQEDEFGLWLGHEGWDKYKKHKMQNRTNIEDQINNLGLKLENGTVNKPYHCKLLIPTELAKDCRLEGCEELGLTVTALEDGEQGFELSGKPTSPTNNSKVKLRYKYNGWIDGEQESELDLPLIINNDPRTLWKNITTDPNIIFYKEDTDAGYIKVGETEESGPRKDIVAASKRGRSHAHEGKARDDHFKLFHSDESDWYIVAVADGAGSARFSRKGSQIACDTVVDICKDKLKDCSEFEEKIRAYKNADDEVTARKEMGNIIYGILANAAFQAHKNINEAAAANSELNATAKDFSTTLMFAICKKFDFGWFVASFWVGDGAMCIYNQEKQTFKMLGSPDEGEYSGQTRFLTMPEIFRNPTELMGRLRFSIEDDFTALMLMTDGVSDPMFETDNNLNNIDKWNELWDALKNGFPDDNIGGVDLSDNNEEAKDQLLNWLDFWSPGNHDDRTIALLY